MFIYCADVWCNECGESLWEELIREKRFPAYWTQEEIERVVDCNGDADLADVIVDSDDWPCQAGNGDITDSPSHCAARADCLNAIDLGDYGLPTDAALYGAEERKVGILLSDQLTEEGESFLRECFAEPSPTPYQLALWEYWRTEIWLSD